MKIKKPEYIRKINTKLVLDIIRKNSGCARSFIAKKLSCSRQTVSKIVVNLISLDLLQEQGLGESTKEGGKKPTILIFNPKGGYSIGAMLLRNKIISILTDLNANIIIEKSIPTFVKDGYKAIVEEMIGLFEEMITESGIKKEKLLGIGIGVQGIVNFSEGVIKTLPHYPDWVNIPLAKYIKDKLGCEVFIDNENRMRGYGEKWFGLATNTDNFLTIYAEEGLGAGVFIEGKAIRGAGFFAGEIGHMKLDINGPDCICGNKGCFESLINVARIRQLFDKYADSEEFKDSMFVKKYKNNNLEITIKELFNHFYQGDNLAKHIVNEISYWFGVGIAAVSSVIDPELIIIHGQYISGRDYFRKKIINYAKKEFLPNVLRNVNVKYSKIGRKSGLIGSASIVLEEMI